MQRKKEMNHTLFRTMVTASEQRKAEKLLTLLFRLPHIIEGNQNKVQLQENQLLLEVLTNIYNSITDEHRNLWSVRYDPRNMNNCETAIIQLQIGNRNTYFKQKFELIGYIMDAFDLWEEGDEE